MGCRFYLSILDDYSKYVWPFPINAKFDVPPLLLHFLSFSIIPFLTRLFWFKLMEVGSFAHFGLFFNLVAFPIALLVIIHIHKMELLRDVIDTLSKPIYLYSLTPLCLKNTRLNHFLLPHI